jgi:hypothetical protein
LTVSAVSGVIYETKTLTHPATIKLFLLFLPQYSTQAPDSITWDIYNAVDEVTSHLSDTSQTEE